MTAVLNQVRALIERLSPEPICDDCIAERLAFSRDQHADHRTHELAGMTGFERGRDACAICNEVKPVIRKTR